MAIDVRAISITGAFNAIKSFFQSQENNSKWKDLETGSEGNFLMRMLANIIKNISQFTITGRREVFHDTANLLSSNIGLAVNNGYPVYRGRNQRRLINFTPKDNMTLPKFTRLGTYAGEYGIYTLEDLAFVANEPQEFTVVIGNLREVTWTANTANIKRFVRFEQYISEDVDILIDNLSLSKENAITRYKKDMLYDKYCIYTNPWKSVTIEYLNNASGAKYRYDADTTFTLKYIELEDIQSSDFTEDMFAEYGILNNVITIENFVDFETVEDIKTNSPIHRETQNLVRSKADFADLVRSFSPSIQQTNYKALTPTYTAVTYMKGDSSLIEDHEYREVMVQLDPCMAFGRPLPDIVDPVKETTTLDITVGLVDKYTDETSVTADVQSIVDANFANILHGDFDKYELENLINKLSYVRYSRVDLHIAERQMYTNYKIGDMVAAHDMVYKCTGILGLTNINEPEWNIPSIDAEVKSIYTGLETYDKELVWVCYKRLDVEGLQPWKPNKKFKVGDYVYSDSIPQYMFKCVDVLRTTAVETPSVVGVEVGDYINDASMVLLCINYNASYPARLGNAYYRLGDKFNLGGLSFEYVGTTGYTSSDEVLTFNDAKYELFTFSEEDFEDAYRNDGNQVCLYIQDTAVANMVNPGDILRINTVESVNKKWEEVEADKLVLNSKITAKVKAYQDVDVSPESDTPTDTPDIPESTVEITNYYTGNTIPDISKVKMGDTIMDGELYITRVPFDEIYPERLSVYAYNTNDHFTISVYNNSDVLQYQYSFVVATPSVKETTTTTAPKEEAPEDTPVVQNANWKELEKYLAIQDDIQEWIISEGTDKLHCPADVIQFFYEVGRLSTEERDMLTQYYVQYDEADEKQIYMYMDQMNATRLEAIAMLTREDSSHKNCKHLKEPISDANCVRMYSKDDETKLIYIDTFSNIDGGFTVSRSEFGGVLRAIRTYIYSNNQVLLQEETINMDSELVSKVYLVTAKFADTPRRNVNGRVTYLTRIVPTTTTNKYTSGYVDISFTKTDDGEIRWEQVASTDEIEYGWNVYANYNVNLTVKY